VISLGHPDLWKGMSHLPDRPPHLFEAWVPMFGWESIEYANGEEYKRRKRNYIDPTFNNKAVETVHYKVFR
jgi:hypothetical protein